MSANNALHIAVLGGDGIGPEVMAPALEVLRKIEATTDLKFRFTEAPAGANNYLATGKSMPESTVRLCDEADAILLGACGLPSVRYPDNTEIMPQVELRFHFDLYAGVRPARLIPGVPSPIVGADQKGIDLVVIRESTEGLFASMGKGVVTDTEARETLVITRKTSERLFEFSFRLAERRKARGRANGGLTCVDKANVFKAFAFFREMFDEAAKRHPDVKTDRLYVDACSALLVKRPWDFDVMVMENMFGDILSDLDGRPDRRHGHGAVGRYRRPPCRVPALPRHRARYHGAGQGQPDRDDPLGRDDAGLARRQARARKRRRSRRAHRARGRQGLCGWYQADGVRRQQRHGRYREGGAGGAVSCGRDVAPQTAVIPREGGGPSTPRLLGSIIGASGILDHPPSRVMTSVVAALQITRFAFISAIASAS